MVLHLLASSECDKVGRNIHYALQSTAGSWSTFNNNDDHFSPPKL
jgi:hypothetical protein